MNWLQKTILGIRSKGSVPPKGTISPVPMAGRFVEVNGSLTWMPDNLNSYIVNGYQANDIIYACNKLIMDKVEVAPWGLYKVVDEQELRKYHSFVKEKNWVEARICRRKALEPMTKFNLATGRLKELLQWPNEEDTFNALVAADAGFVNITGNNYMWGNMLDAGANKGLPGELWNLPAQHMVIKATREFPQRKTGYQLTMGIPRAFSAEEVMHEKLFNPDYNATGAGLYGMSPIKAALKTLTRNNASKKAGATQLENNGAAGIAYLDDAVVPVTGRNAQAGIIKEAWQGYTGPEKYGKIAFSGYKMGYVQVGLSLKDMALSELEQVDMRIIANIWNLPSQLLNDPENKSYNNQKEAEKALTSRCAIPRLTSTRNNFNRKIQTDWGFKGQDVYVDFDMSVYTELQEDQKEKWEWVDKLPVSSKYKLEMMGLDVPDDPNMEVILVNGNYMPLADVIMSMSDDQRQQLDDELNKAGLNDYLRVAK